MPLNKNAMMRMRTIDKCLQNRYRRWTIEDLRQACEDAMYEYEGSESVSLRTVQRDIEIMRGDKLGYFAPIVVRDRKYYEYEDPDYTITQLPLSKRDLEELGSALDIIRNYQGFSGMSGQEDIVTRMQDQLHIAESHDQVVFIETNRQLRGLHHLAPLYDFIRSKTPILITYHSFKNEHEVKFYMSPYILCEYNNRWFLVCYNRRKGVMTLALDRMISVEKDPDGTYIENTFFKPEEYLGEMVGVTRALNTKPVHVLLRFDPMQAPYVLTKPMHSSQALVEQFLDGSVTVSLDVILNIELESKILAYGCHVEVLSPRLLRHNISKALAVAAAQYQQLRPEAE